MDDLKNKIADIRLGIVLHDMRCSDPDKMYLVEFAERMKFIKGNFKTLLTKMILDGREDELDQVKNDPTIIFKAFDEYGISNEQPEIDPVEHEQNQSRCIKNLMNDFSISEQDAKAFIQIWRGGR